MLKVLKGTLLKNGKFYEFKIFLYAPEEIVKDVSAFLEHKLQQKGWMPNVP